MDQLPVPALTELLPQDAQLGREMKRLSPKARAFVLALIELGGKDMQRAASMAGFTGTKASISVTASRLAADPRVQAAIMEEAKSLMQSSALLAVSEAVKIMQDPLVKPGFKLQAIKMCLDVSGMQAAQKIDVRHTVEVDESTQAKIEEVKRMSQKMGLDPRKLLGAAGITLDAEFEVVGSTEGLEDML